MLKEFKTRDIDYFQQGINPGLGGVRKRSLTSKDSVDAIYARLGPQPDTAVRTP